MIEVRSVKNCLENWRELVVHADAVLGWEKDFYPAITAGLLTFKFIFIWYWDPTLLTLLAMTGLLFTLADYIGPKIMDKVFKKENWTAAKEKKFDNFCHEVVAFFAAIEACFRSGFSPTFAA